MVTRGQTIGSNIHLIGQCMFFWKPENRCPSFAGLNRPNIANRASHSTQHFEDHNIDRAGAALLPTPRKRIPLHTSPMLNLAHVPDASNEVRDSLHAWPDGFDAGLAIAFAREEAAEPGDEP